MRVLVSANDDILYDAKLVGLLWICGRCGRGEVEPTVGAHCSECPAHVNLVVLDQERVA
jgi:hypothetical protein